MEIFLHLNVDDFTRVKGETTDGSILDGFRSYWSIKDADEETSQLGSTILQVGYWSALVIFCIRGLTYGALLFNMIAFWVVMLVVFQLSFCHSEMTFNDWY